MNANPRLPIWLILAISIFSHAPAQGIEFFHGTVEEVFAEAKSSQKLVFVDCYTEWCGPCKMMVTKTFPNDTVGQFFNAHFVNYTLDMEKGEGVAFARKYGIGSYPTLLFLDAKGNIVHFASGFRNPSKFVALGQQALDPAGRMDKMLAEFKNGNRSMPFLTEYILEMRKNGRPVSEAVNEWVKGVNPEELLSDSTYFAVFIAVFSRIDTELFRYFVDHRAEFIQVYGETKVHNKIANNYSDAIRLALRAKNKEKAESLKADYRKLGIPKTDCFMLDFAYNESKEAGFSPEIIGMATELAEVHHWDHWGYLNFLVRDFCMGVDDPIALQSAEKWALRSIELAENYLNFSTYGKLLKKMGRAEEAILYLEKAIEKAQETGIGYSSEQQALDELKGK